LDKYYKILRIPANSRLEDIKKAYRKLAHEFHPDVSRLSDARERFIEINEAYEYLTNKLKLEQALKANYNEHEETAQEIIDAWLAGERERMRARAKKYADMKYRNFKKSETYRATLKMDYSLQYAGLVLGCFVIAGCFWGVLSQWKSNPVFVDAGYIIRAIIASLVGFMMLSFSGYKILERLTKKKKKY
jgi:curved DNA-binding protein CbpA